MTLARMRIRRHSIPAKAVAGPYQWIAPPTTLKRLGDKGGARRVPRMGEGWIRTHDLRFWSSRHSVHDRSGPSSSDTNPSICVLDRPALVARVAVKIAVNLGE